MDLKEMYCERSEELAMEIYDKEFYDLTQDQQIEVWQKAERDVVDGIADHADNLKKASKEGI